MGGLVSAIHALLLRRKDVDARDKRGHDGGEGSISGTLKKIERRAAL
jgi:hypothetical protein